MDRLRTTKGEVFVDQLIEQPNRHQDQYEEPRQSKEWVHERKKKFELHVWRRSPVASAKKGSPVAGRAEPLQKDGQKSIREGA